MAEQTQTDAPPSCPTFNALPEKEQKMILDAFNLAVGMAERANLPEVELFQLLEDVIDGRAADEVLAEMKRTGEKPKSWDEFEKELDADRNGISD